MLFFYTFTIIYENILIYFDKNIASLIKEKIYNSRRILIISHRNPDGDALGSALALTHVLIKKHKSVKVLVPDSAPRFLRWMPGFEHVIVFKNEKTEALQCLEKSDIIFCVDFNDISRIQEFSQQFEQSKAFKITIDHHASTKDFADIVCSFPNVSSTAELIYDLIEGIDSQMLYDTNVAECIFTGILTDTICFSVNSSNPYTYTITSKLLNTGIDKNKIHSNIYNNSSAERITLLGHALKNKMTILPEFNTGYIVLSKKDLYEHKYESGDTEGFVNYPLLIRDICFSVLFIERSESIKLSFRSKGKFSVNEFAQKHFNGGGHINASGGEIRMSLDAAVEKFLLLLPEYRNELLKSREVEK